MWRRISIGESATLRSSTRIAPRVGARKPRSDLSSVLFPAPFGPSRPTAPRGNTAVTSARAGFRPYDTVTLLRSTTRSDEVASGMQLGIRESWLERSLQPQVLRPLAHREDHGRDVVRERHVQRFGAGLQVL